MTEDVAVVNWGGAESPIETGVYGAVNQVWFNQMAHANVWAEMALDNDNLNRQQDDRDVQAWSKAQDDWRTTWAIAQAAYAAAQVLLANNALKPAQDAADKQYDIANRQQDMAQRATQAELSAAQLQAQQAAAAVSGVDALVAQRAVVMAEISIVATSRLVQRIVKKHVGCSEFIDDVEFACLAPEIGEPTPHDGFVVVFLGHGEFLWERGAFASL
ncbi:hypothetical protein CBA19CS22_39635 [Caballeronia novacaledonica]|uniref:Uncharacterized protein n=1 Tax=Caballeronia novacaledonica TaxID=1544861 RepID=A0ACB5R5W1_9BURK|nr:hypothetical protein CBA19CS22_39635 [Caballeronia novacaledonica]